MKILCYNNHTPFCWNLIKAFPEFDWTVTGWSILRPHPKARVVSIPQCFDDEYDVVIENEKRGLPLSQAKCKRRILVEHCENSDILHVLKDSMQKCDKVVSVSEHKRLTMRELAWDNKVTTIRLYVPTDDFPIVTQNRTGIVGTVCNAIGTDAIGFVRETLAGFNNLVIGHANEHHKFEHSAVPISFKDYKDRLSTLQVFVHCIVGDVMGLSPMEAMMSGIPIITGCVPEGWNMIFDGYNGFISRSAPINSIPWVRDKITWLLQNPDEASEIGKRGRKAVIEYQPLERFRRQWLDVLYG